MADEVDSGHLRVAWKWVGLGSIILAIGSLGTLAVVATVNGADALSTVALSLAVLAFVIQILTFVAQTWVAMQQNNMSQSLNAETRGMLTELRTRSQDTNSILNEQYNKLLDQMLAVTKDTVKDASTENAFDFTELQSRLSLDLQRVVEEARESAGGSTSSSRPSDHSGPSRPSRLRSMRVWPTEKIIKRLADEGMADLNDASLRALKDFADDYMHSIRSDLPDGMFMTEENRTAVEELLRRGFLTKDTEFSPHPETGLPMLRLTAMGRAAARLFLAHGATPPQVSELLPKVARMRAGS